MAGGTGKGGYTAADIRAALPTDEEIYNLAELSADPFSLCVRTCGNAQHEYVRSVASAARAAGRKARQGRKRGERSQVLSG